MYIISNCEFVFIYRLPKKKSQCPRHRKMTGLLYWLSREKEIESALTRLLNVIPLKERDLVREKLVFAIQMYKLETFENISTEVDGDTLLSDITKMHFQDINLAARIDMKFLDGYRCTTFPSWLMDVILHHQIYLPCQVEDKEHPSSHYFAERLLQTICEIVLSYDKSERHDEQFGLIKIIGREGSKCVTKNLQCSPTAISNYSNLNQLDALNHQKLLLRSLNIFDEDKDNVIISCDNNLQLLFCCLRFWCSRTRDSSILSPNNTEFGAVIAMISIYQRSTTSLLTKDQKNEGLSKLFAMNQVVKSHKKEFDITIVQSFANLQATLLYAIIINRLLGFPMEEPPLHKIWNSTILYNIASTFNGISEIQTYFSLKEFDEYLNLCGTFIPTYHDLKTKVILGKRRKPKNRPVRENVRRPSIDEGEVAELSSNDGVDEYKDMSNKFSLLSTV